MNTSRVYGGGNAASARDPATPHGAKSHVASPKIMPEPVAINDGPSSFSAGPRWKRLVSTRSPNTAISEAPKITHVVGCVYAATMPSTNSAVLAPHDVRPGSKNARIIARKYRTVRLSRYPTYGVVSDSAAVASMTRRNSNGSRCLRQLNAPSARPVSTGTPTIMNALKV